MARLFEGNSLSETWLQACEYLFAGGGKAANVSLVVPPHATEDLRVRSVLDETDWLKMGRFSRVRKVADSIFPWELYRHADGDNPGDARNRLYWQQGQRRIVMGRDLTLRSSYFDRFVNWTFSPGYKREPFNQLEENVVLPLLRARTNHRTSANYMELPSNPLDELTDLRVHEPSKDRQPLGVPCLSHISFTLIQGALTLTAIYRNHYYITKAYGNLVGLRDLQRFVCEETGYAMGELECVSSHADLFENPSLGKRKVENLLLRCRDVLRATPTTPLRVAA